MNAYKAVGGMYGGAITPDQQLYRWPVVDELTVTATFSGGDGSFTYQWDNGATSPATTVYAQYFENQGPGTIRARISASVTITDLSDGGKLHIGFGHNFTEPPEGCSTCVTDPP
ncbi:MAG: hypothetical protein WKF55_00435 [Gemmatimonadaceae bacterium]